MGKTSDQKFARALQRLAEDELGARPSLQGCHNIVRDYDAGEGSIEVRAARLFEVHRDRLAAIAGRR